MRAATRDEYRILREKRSFFDKVVLRLFRKTVNRFFCKHLSRAYEVSVIDTHVLHDLDYYMKVDLGFYKRGKDWCSWRHRPIWDEDINKLNAEVQK